MTRATYSLTGIEGPLFFDKDGQLTFLEKGGIDYAPATVQVCATKFVVDIAPPAHFHKSIPVHVCPKPSSPLKWTSKSSHVSRPFPIDRIPHLEYFTVHMSLP